MVTRSAVGNADLAHMVGKTRDAVLHGSDGMSTGEKLTVALVLNRPDWLMAINYTIAEALERIGDEWVRLIPAVAQQFKQERDATAYEAAVEEHESRLDEFTKMRRDDNLEFKAHLVTSGNAPGYRYVYLTFDLHPRPNSENARPAVRATLSLSAQDGEEVVREITRVHRFAWRKDRPIDVAAGEVRPRWLGPPSEHD